MFRLRKKKKSFKKEIEKLDYNLYVQISLYKNRANTKYHRGIIDALNSVRVSLNEILKGEKE